MCIPNIKIVNKCRRDLPEELVEEIVDCHSFGAVSNIADQYNLRVAEYEVEFDRDNNKKTIIFTIGDTPGAV